MDNIKKEKYSTDELECIIKEYSYNEIIKRLNDDSEDDFIKIFSILNIEKINTQEDALIFIKLLTNHPTPIREAVALKLEELSCEAFFLNDYTLEKLTNAVIDINPNVCRAICNFISKNTLIAKEIEPRLISNIEIITEKIKDYEKENKDFFDNKIKNRKNHTKNKLLFSLYWSLEAITTCLNEKSHEKLLKIISYLINFSDYTIREKAVKILTMIPSAPNDLLQIASKDLNFYVKNHIYGKMSKEIVK